MKNIYLVICGLLAAVFALTPRANAQPAFSVAGPESMTEIMFPATLEAFARNVGLTIRREISGNDAFALTLVDPNALVTVARFDIQVSDTPTALAALAQGRVDFALATHAPEMRIAASVISLGRDALIPIVGKSNPIDEISIEALGDVLAGNITDWADLGGPSGPIRLHLLEEGTDQDVYLRTHILGNRDRGGAIKLHLTESGIADAVTNDPMSLGIGTYSDLGNAKALKLGGACGIAVRAGRTEIKNGDYPLSTPLNLHYRDANYPQVVMGFLSFLTMANAQGPIRQAGFVDSKAEIVPLTDQGDRLANAIRIVGRTSPASELRRLVNELDGAGRLSYSFRFLPKSNDLDGVSRTVVQQLGHGIRDGLFDGKELIFVGFSDGVGSAEQNLRIALGRARGVEAAVREVAGSIGERVTMDSESFGEALPISCDESDWGKHANRRVEVWVR